MEALDPARKRPAKQNPALSTYTGAHVAGGPARPVKAVLAHRKEKADLRVRFRFLEQRAFIEEAASKTDPPESISLFLASAALERAARVLGRPAPDPPPAA